MFNVPVNIIYLRFPLNNEPNVHLKKWLIAMKRDSFKSSTGSKLSIEHLKGTIDFLKLPYRSQIV